MPWIEETSECIDSVRMEALMHDTVAEARRRICDTPKRVLLLPPDITRMHSGAGKVTEMLYHLLADGVPGAEVHVIPTLGQHVPHTPEQNREMFGTIPNDRIHAHDWIGGCTTIGEIPAEFVQETSDGAADWAIPLGLNSMLMDQSWDLIINVGHVVPHEVLGFANHNKNYFIGLGSKELICGAHMAAACYGTENNMGNLLSPLRRCFNKA
jgi:nickel-dependent lactate racemase